VWFDWAELGAVGVSAALSVASIVPSVLHLRRLQAARAGSASAEPVGAAK
jgi:hypothetical protein